MKPTDFEYIKTQFIWEGLVAVIYKDLRTGINSVRFYLIDEIISATTENQDDGIEKLIEERADRNDDESDQCETVNFKIHKETAEEIEKWCRKTQVSWSAISVGLSKFFCDPRHFTFVRKLLENMNGVIIKKQMKEDRTSGPIKLEITDFWPKEADRKPDIQ